MALILELLFKAMGPRTVRQFHEACLNPAKTQADRLDQIVKRNAATAFGDKHGFANVYSVGSYQSGVPICEYEDLRPYVDATMNGTQRQLTAESPKMFTSTSGTTGKPKYIPVTTDSRAANSQRMRVWIAGLFADHPDIFRGEILSLVSPEVEDRAPSGIPIGAESGHIYRNMPRALRSSYAIPYPVYEVSDYETKYYSLLRIAAAKSISIISTANPSTVLLLANRLGQNTETIIRDVRDGGLSDRQEVPRDLREIVARSYPPDRERATYLERAAGQNGGELLPMHVWPELVAIGCWKGGTVGMYVERFDKFYPEGVAVRDLGYLASEHQGSVPLSDEGDAGVLAIASNFYEFYPADEDTAPSGTDLLTVDQLKEGGRYFIYVTTSSGLYRYNMNDIIEVTGFHERTPLIRFVQKGKGVVSFTGEKLYESQVIDAVGTAFSNLDGEYEFITAIGEMHGEQPRYAFLVEFPKPLDESLGRTALDTLEQALRSNNVEYAAKRDSGRIDPPVLRMIRHGEFDRYRRRMVEEEGRPDGQFKILRLTADASFGDEFSAVGEVDAG